MDEMKALKFTCEKVIIITHSMGGFVARYCSEVLGNADKIAGIFHVAMPDNGSPATYKRMKSGFEGGFLNIASSYLGNDGEDVTAVLGHAPGGLELLPNKHYYDANGNKGTWLQLQQEGNHTVIADMSNPYANVYTQINPWWRLITPEWLVPEVTGTKEKQEDAVEKVFNKQYLKTINGTVKVFHDKLAEQKHCFTFMLNNINNELSSFDQVVWESDENLEDRNSQQVLADDTYEDTNERTITLDSNWINDEVVIMDASAGGDGTVHAGVIHFTKNCFKRMSINSNNEHQKMMDAKQVRKVSRIFIIAALKNYEQSKVEVLDWKGTDKMLENIGINLYHD
jgi:hypothetical protein